MSDCPPGCRVNLDMTNMKEIAEIACVTPALSSREQTHKYYG